jgi:hypothetical protein
VIYYIEKLFKEEYIMKKSDLKTGMVVELKTGEKYMVILDSVKTIEGITNGILIANDGWIPLSNYNENLENPECTDYNVIAVYNPNVCGFKYMFDNCSKSDSPIWVNWSVIARDTKVLVKAGMWGGYYFSYFDNGNIHIYMNGRSSFSADSTYDDDDNTFIVDADNIILYEGNESLLNTPVE